MVLTGIELALAVVPLILAGKDTYAALYRQGKTISQPSVKKEKHQDFLRELGLEMEMLRLTLETLIQDLTSLSLDDRQRLLDFDNFDRKFWKSEMVQDALEVRLQGAHAVFIDTFNAILKSLNDLISDKSLGVNDAPLKSDETRTAVVHNKLEALYHEADSRRNWIERFRFTKNEQARAHGLKRIVDSNGKLERLVNQASKVSGVVKRRRGHKRGPDGGRRNLVKTLHTAMAGSWTCTCAKAHEARLCLPGNLMPSSGLDVTSLDMLISVRTDDGQQGDWQESNVRIVAEKRPRGSGTSIASGRSVKEAADALKPVACLCTEISDRALRNVSVAMELAQGALWRIPRTRRQSLSIRDAATEVNLRDLLKERVRQMSLRDRRRLAVIVAYAVLFFCGDSWLDEDWDQEHISFFPNGDPTMPQDIDFKKPYLTARFRRDSKEADSEDEQGRVHQSPPILALGVLLVELQICGPIESKYTADDLTDGNENAYTKLTAATRLLEESWANMHQGYGEAIDACLECDFKLEEGVTASLNDEKFRSLVYETIVVPLETELRQGWPDALQELSIHG